MTVELAILWLLLGVIVFTVLCLTVGRWLADKWFGRVPGGRGK